MWQMGIEEATVNIEEEKNGWFTRNVEKRISTFITFLTLTH